MLIPPIIHSMKPEIQFDRILSFALLILTAAIIFFPQAASAGSVKLEWDANTQPELAGYRVYYGTASGTYNQQDDVGNVTTYTTPDLAAGTYFFAVKAYGLSGEQSGFSNEVSAVISGSDATPPVISGVASSSITTNGATIAWTTNELSDTQIDYGTSTSYGSWTTLNTAMVTSHSQSLAGLLAGTTYHYRVKSRDAAGNLATSDDSTFTTTTPPPGDTTPPVISGVGSSGISSTGATISWTTNEASNSLVEYGTTTSYGSSTTPNWTMSTTHSQSLSGLTGSTTYHYRVKSTDTAGNQATSGDYTFTTSDGTPPVISNVASSSITSSGATISWTTNEASDSQVEYGMTTGYGSTTTLNTTKVTSHSQSLSGLKAGTTYHYRVKSKDAAGNLATSVDCTFATASDTTPPVISSVAISSITDSGATISWTTNEASDSQVDCGTTSSYGSSTTLNTTMVTSHSQALSGLTASTTYHFHVKSKDASSNLATSGDYTFMTTSDKTPPVISNVTASSITSSGATISWTTNEASDTQVEYGTTTGYGSSTTLNTTKVTSHSQSLSGLTAGTTYHYRVKSRDVAGYQAVSDDYAFSTTSAIDITTGLVAAFAFDEGSGTASPDLSGNGNGASIYSAGWTTGRYGKALSFNGTSSYVSAGVTGLPGINEPKTISCWIYLTTKPRAIQDMLAVANPELKASLEYGYKLSQMGVLNYGDAWMVVSGLPSLRRWHHFGYIFDGSQNRLYIDGKLAGTSTIAPAAAPVTSFQIGRWIEGSQYFKGSIDDVRVYRRALSVDELKAAMNTPVGIAGAAPKYGTPSVMLVTDETTADASIVAQAEPASQPATNPVADIQLEQQAYRQGETLSASAFWISNSSTQSRNVEVKTWMTLPGLLPISLNMSVDDTLNLPAGFNQNYGAAQLLKISSDAPAGTGEVDARLLDPTTGDVLSEDLNPFSIGATKGKHMRTPPILQSAPQVVLESYVADSGVQYIIVNNGATAVAVEFKAWSETPGMSPAPILSVGEDGSLVLPAGASMTLDPTASSQVFAQDLVIKARVLDQASGQILAER